MKCGNFIFVQLNYAILLGTGHYFLSGGGGLPFHKKIVRKLWLAEINCLLQGYEGKNCL